jgi:hypothetical protein
MAGAAAGASPSRRLIRRIRRRLEEEGRSPEAGTDGRLSELFGTAGVRCCARVPRRCRRSSWPNGGRRRVGSGAAAGGGMGDFGAGSGGEGALRGGAGGAGARLTKMLTGGGDLRRESLRFFRRLDFERSESLDMEEGCPRAAAMELAKVSKEAHIFLSIVGLLSWEQASLFARAALLSRGGVPETAELPGARGPLRRRRGGRVPKAAEPQGARGSREFSAADIARGRDGFGSDIGAHFEISGVARCEGGRCRITLQSGPLL